MRQLHPDQDLVSMSASQVQRLREEIGRYRRRLVEIDHPDTVRMFEMLMSDAQARLDQIEERPNAI